MKLPAVLLLWVAAIYRLWSLRRGRSFVTVAYAGAAVSIAAAFAVAAAESEVDSVTGPYLSDLLEHLLAVVGGVAANLFLLGLRTGTPPIRATTRRVSVGAVVVASMIASFIAAPIHDHHAVSDLDVTYGDLPVVIAYRLIFNAYLTYVLVDNVRLCHRYAAIPGDVGRTASLRLVGWGSLVSIAYSVSRIVYIAADVTTHRRIEPVRIIGSVAAAVGLCGLAIGMLAPGAARRLHAWWTSLRGLHDLKPLWRDVTTVWPDLVLPTPAPTTPRRAELRVARWLVEASEGAARAGVKIDAAGSAEMYAHRLWQRLRENTHSPVQATGSLTSREQERTVLLAVSRAYGTRPTSRHLIKAAA